MKLSIYNTVKSKNPGRSVEQSPTVACLYKPYILSLSSSGTGLVGLKVLTSAADASNCSFKDDIIKKKLCQFQFYFENSA